MAIDDTLLIARAASGDANAFTEIVRRHRDMVYGYCYHRTGSFEDARDLAQDTFVRAYTSLHQLRDHSKLAAWLRRIAANLCTRWYERRRETAAEIPDIAEPARHSGASECVGEALASLPENERLAVVLHYVNGYSYGDIAGFLEVTQAAVRGRLHRGREMLRAEVLKMTRDAFDENRLDEEFVVEAVKTAVDEAEDAYNMLGDERLSRKKTDEAATLVDQIKQGGVEDPVALGDALSKLGMREFILGESDRAHRHWDRAKSLYEQAGDRDGTERWRSAMAYGQLRDGDLRTAHELYSQVAQYWHDRRSEPTSGSMAAVRALESIGLDTDSSKVISILLGVCSFKREDGQILHMGSPGFGFAREEEYPVCLEMGGIVRPPFGPTPLPFVLMREEPAVGDRLEFKADFAWRMLEPGEESPIEVSMMETLSDGVITPAGEFHRCARASTRISRQGEELATRKLWFAPGTGLVKIALQETGKPANTSELVAYHVQSTSNDCVPLAVGNWWKYRWIEGEEELGFRTELYREIVAQEGDRFPTIQYSFCVKT